MERRKRDLDAYRKAKDPDYAAAARKLEETREKEASSPVKKQASFRTTPAPPPGPAPSKDQGIESGLSSSAGGGGKKSPSGPAVAGLLRTTGVEKPYRKAAKFLMLLGKDEASKVMRHFTEEDVEAISREIAGIKRIETAEAEKLLEEFGFLKEASRFPVGGIETARRILVNAFGEEKGREILTRSVPPSDSHFFSFLEEFEPVQIHHLLRHETPAVLAVILPFLGPEKGSRLLPLFEPDFRTEFVKRLAKRQKINREVLLGMEEALREKARKLSSPTPTVEVDGKAVLADILKFMDLHNEEAIIESLEEESPVIAREIKDRLFTIDVLEFIEDQDLQKLLHGMDDKEIALLLKGKSDGIRAKILGNLSERRRGFVADEYRVLGPVPKGEADDATKEFLNLLKRLESQGSLVIRRENEKMVE
jgi:flagellar motor switch protein FliG